MKILKRVCAALAIYSLLFPVPVSAGERLTGYGETYVTAGGVSRVHHGVDMSVAPGGTYASPCGGTVAFAGRVPTVEGTSVLAVSIDTALGRMSVMPLESLSVRAGETVIEGVALGRIAGTGDASSPLPHAHVSLRVAGEYMDPAALLGAAAQGEPEAAVEPEAGPAAEIADPAAVPAGEGAGMPVASSDAAAAPLTAAGAPSGAGAPAEALSGAIVAAEAGPAAEPAAVSGPVGGEAGSASPTQPMTGLEAMKGLANGRVAELVHAAHKACWRVSTFSHPLSRYACLTVPFLLALGAPEERKLIQSVSHRLGTLLRQSRAGATIRGLTSCSGR